MQFGVNNVWTHDPTTTNAIIISNMKIGVPSRVFY